MHDCFPSLTKVEARSLFQDWIGKQFGIKAASKSGDKWVYLLAPTPELWTVVLRHRTQILYLADISLICLHLELRPGCIVLESGTGSGSLTTSLARAVGPKGKVYTFEFHSQRATLAREDFERNGLSSIITVEQRNVEEDGFPADLDGIADAVFLDLPEPWKAVPWAAKSLRPDGVLCGFSPCAEQVQETCKALNDGGFWDFHTYEILLREFEVTCQDRSIIDRSGLEEMLVQQGQFHGEMKDDTRKRRHDESSMTESKTVDTEHLRKVVARPVAQGRGHTGYLTFARKVVDSSPAF